MIIGIRTAEKSRERKGFNFPKRWYDRMRNFRFCNSMDKFGTRVTRFCGSTKTSCDTNPRYTKFDVKK